MKLNQKEIVASILMFFLIYLFVYYLICTLLIVYYFGRKMEDKLLEQLNSNINIFNKPIEKKSILKSVLQRDKIIGVIVFLLFLLILIISLFIINQQTFKNIYKNFKLQIGINLLLVLVFNVPIFVYIIFYSSRFVRINLKG